MERPPPGLVVGTPQSMVVPPAPLAGAAAVAGQASPGHDRVLRRRKRSSLVVFLPPPCARVPHIVIMTASFLLGPVLLSVLWDL